MSKSRYAAYSFILAVALVLLFFFAVRGMNFFLVPSISMEPVLREGDYILTLKSAAYEPGDVVVFDDPLNKGEFLVKRIVGVAGDTVELRDGALYVDGAYAAEPYVKEPLEINFPAFTVPSGCVFVLGDNRKHSEDSSSPAWNEGGWECGPAIDVKTVIGRVRRIYLPVNRSGSIESYPLRSFELPK